MNIDVPERVRARAQAICRQLADCRGMYRYMPLAWSALVETGELSDTELWRAVKQANRAAEPQSYLNKAVQRIVGRQVGEALGAELLPICGIEWDGSYRQYVPPKPPPASKTHVREQADLVERLFDQARMKRLPDGTYPSFEDANAEFLELAKRHGIPDAVARQRIEGT